jgi:Listeria-Bacteroides repeat domain (List_Bact_rpt).
MYTRGSSEGNASVTDYVYVYNNAEPMKFSGTENTYRVGYFQKGKTYNYDIHFANQTMTHSTMIKSWKVYKADASGHSTGEEVQLGDGTKVISMKQYAEKDYLKARGTSATTNQSPFEYNKFKAPDYDIVIDLVKSGSRFLHWNTKADGSGTSYNAGDTFGINGSDVVLYAIWTKDSDTPSSPGTGESAMLILLALAAMGVSAAVAGGIITSHRRSRRQHEA